MSPFASEQRHVVCLLATDLDTVEPGSQSSYRSHSRPIISAVCRANSTASVTLTRKADGWWLTLTAEEEVSLQTQPEAPVVGADVGITHFLTTSTGKHYGSFQEASPSATAGPREAPPQGQAARLPERQGRNSALDARSQYLAPTVRQEINRARQLSGIRHTLAGQIAS